MLVRRCLTAPVAEASDSEKLGLHGLRKYQNLSTRGCSTSDPHRHYNWLNTFFSKGERETTPANVSAINLLTAKALIFRPPLPPSPRLAKIIASVERMRNDANRSGMVRVFPKNQWIPMNSTAFQAMPPSTYP